MSQDWDEQLRQIEATQQELKQSIQRSRELAETAQQLLERHRKDVVKQ